MKDKKIELNLVAMFAERISHRKVANREELINILNKCYKSYTIGSNRKECDCGECSTPSLRLKLGRFVYHYLFSSNGWNTRDGLLCEGNGENSWRVNKKKFKSAEEYFIHLPAFLRKGKQ